MAATLTSMGAELQSQNRVDVNYEKTQFLSQTLQILEIS